MESRYFNRSTCSEWAMLYGTQFARMSNITHSWGTCEIKEIPCCRKNIIKVCNNYQDLGKSTSVCRGESKNLKPIFWFLDCFSICSRKLEGLLHTLRYTCSSDLKGFIRTHLCIGNAITSVQKPN